MGDLAARIYARFVNVGHDPDWRTSVLLAELTELEEWRAEVEEDCLHYGAIQRSFDGGRLSVFCLVCGRVIFHWTPTATREPDPE